MVHRILIRSRILYSNILSHSYKICILVLLSSKTSPSVASLSFLYKVRWRISAHNVTKTQKDVYLQIDLGDFSVTYEILVEQYWLPNATGKSGGLCISLLAINVEH